MLSLTVTPLCLLMIGLLDPISAVIALVTLPLVPLFMILVGKLTVGRSERLIADMRSLWSQLLDLVDGLPTLRALGRERGPEKMVRDLGDRHRTSAMGSLKYAFLSSMVLELLATLCVALIAVSIGMRLVYGEMELAPALAVLVLAPEIYQPLRNVGSQYHSSTDGLAAVSAAFEVLDEEPTADGTRPAPDLRTSTLRLRGVSVRSRDGFAPHRAELEVRPGRVLALTGPSGAGKTTAAQVLLGLLEADEGSGRDHRLRRRGHGCARGAAAQPLGPGGAPPPAAGAATWDDPLRARRRPPGRRAGRARCRGGGDGPGRGDRRARLGHGPRPCRAWDLPRGAAASRPGPGRALPRPAGGAR